MAVQIDSPRSAPQIFEVKDLSCREFIESISKQMAHFGHKVEGTQDKPIFIFTTFDDENNPTTERISWTDLKAKMFKTTPESYKIPHDFCYNEFGIVEHNIIKWKKLRPSWIDKTPIPEHFFIEVVSRELGSISRHCWVRLIDDKSRVTSVGLCGKEFKLFPFRTQVGKLANLDPTEFGPGEKHITRIEITKDQYQNLVKKIEYDQNHGLKFFNMKSRNCSIYTTELLREIKVDVKNREFLSQAIARKVAMKLNIKTCPIWIMKTISAVASFFRYVLHPIYVIGSLALGAMYKDKTVAEMEKKYKQAKVEMPKLPYRSWRDWFTSEGALIATGWKVTEWQRFVKEQRDQKIAALDPLNISDHESDEYKAKVFEIMYSIPDEVEHPELPLLAAQLTPNANL